MHNTLLLSLFGRSWLLYGVQAIGQNTSTTAASDEHAHVAIGVVITMILICICSALVIFRVAADSMMMFEDKQATHTNSSTETDQALDGTARSSTAAQQAYPVVPESHSTGGLIPGPAT